MENDAMKRILVAAALASLSFAAFPQASPGEKPPPNAPRFTERTTPGWSMMSAEERKAHKDKMAAFKDYNECQSYMAEHYKQMEERAKEKGKKLGGKSPGPGCNWLKK
jgi:hypothetical protein